MVKPMLIGAGQFKAECLALLDKVAATGEPIIVTKRGKPVAQVVPLTQSRRSLLGSVEEVGDIMAPFDDVWNANA